VAASRAITKSRTRNIGRPKERNATAATAAGSRAQSAADFGVSPAELVEASARPDGRQNLLEKRLAALGVDRDQIADLLPVLMRDLERTCGACPDKKHCAKDMDVSALQPGWENYCPNSGTLRALL